MEAEGQKEDWGTSVILSTLTKRFWIYFEIRSNRIYQSGVGGGRGITDHSKVFAQTTRTYY